MDGLAESSDPSFFFQSWLAPVPSFQMWNRFGFLVRACPDVVQPRVLDRAVCVVGQVLCAVLAAESTSHVLY